MGIALEAGATPIKSVDRLVILYGSYVLSDLASPGFIRSEPDVGRYVIRPQDARISRMERLLRVKPGFTPILSAADPLFIQRQLHFHVSDVSVNTLKLKTSLSNRHLLPGMKLREMHLTLPGQMSPIRADGEIVDVVVQSDNLAVLLAINTTEEQKASLAQFAMFAVEKDNEAKKNLLPALARYGLSTKKVASALKIELVGSEQDLTDVLHVRHEAYRAAEKTALNSTAADMKDGYDDPLRSQIYAARLDGNVVATVRLVFCRVPQDRFPCEDLFGTLDIDWSTRKENFEACRLAILPEYQGTDIVLALFRTVWEVHVRAARRDVYIAATESLWDLYRKLGARELASGVTHPVLKSQKMGLFAINGERSRNARGMAAISWELTVKATVHHLERYGLIRRPRFEVLIRLRRQLELLILKCRRFQKRRNLCPPPMPQRT